MASETIIGVDMGGTTVSIGKVEANRVVRHLTASITTGGEEKQIMNEIIESIEKVFDQNVTGIGIGVPSVVDIEKGIVYSVVNIPSWKEVPIKDILENHFHRPTYVNNDANCFAVGEKHFGKGKNYRNMVGVTLGTGLGAGIIIDNRLYSGTNCGAGEFGTISYKDKVIEYYCSGQFFIHEHGVKGQTVHEKAKQGDRSSLEIFQQFGTHLGEAVKTIMFAVDPEAIILGGSVCRSYSFFQDAMWKQVKTFPYKNSLERLVIEKSEEEQIAILGAAALYYDAQLSKKP